MQSWAEFPGGWPPLIPWGSSGVTPPSYPSLRQGGRAILPCSCPAGAWGCPGWGGEEISRSPCMKAGGPSPLKESGSKSPLKEGRGWCRNSKSHRRTSGQGTMVSDDPMEYSPIRTALQSRCAHTLQIRAPGSERLGNLPMDTQLENEGGPWNPGPVGLILRHAPHSC